MSQVDTIHKQADGQEKDSAHSAGGCCHQADDHGAHSGHAHHGHGWMMMACCVPMLVIAIVLVATGIATFGAIAGAVMCMLMMGMMMGAMSRGGHRR